MKPNYQDLAPSYHLKHRGKLAIKAKVKVRNQRDLSLAYTPGVAAVSQLIASDKSKSFSHTFRGNAIAIISDGSAILGLGNLGAEAALPVMEGKALLFKEFANIDAFPICLATQDDEEIIKTVKQLAPNFAGINLEDISAPRCFAIEKRLKAELSIPVLHDDQHGTAAVVLAGLINALKLKNLEPSQAKVIINGAGAAGTAIAKMLINYGFANITVLDSQGAIASTRADLSGYKQELAQLTNKSKRTGSLTESIVGADIFIGVSKAKVLTEEHVRTMAKDPIIFALANPEPEIMPELALSAGALVVATGRSDFPNQINNVLAFPGIFRGALDNKVAEISEAMLISAAKNLANTVKKVKPSMILPPVFSKRVAPAVARAIK